jgi:hypothetical protein
MKILAIRLFTYGIIDTLHFNNITYSKISINFSVPSEYRCANSHNIHNIGVSMFVF